jgi:hypothetical protein
MPSPLADIDLRDVRALKYLVQGLFHKAGLPDPNESERPDSVNFWIIDSPFQTANVVMPVHER